MMPAPAWRGRWVALSATVALVPVAISTAVAPPPITDQDGDGWCIPACGLQLDCDDGNPNVYPGAPEVCDGIDQDCDGSTDDETADEDGDGYQPCDLPLDCDDTDPSVYPGAPELCDGVLNNCEPPFSIQLPFDELDVDGDGFIPCLGDCDDSNSAVFPGAPELCDGVLNDCNDWATAPIPWPDEPDGDGDGWPVCNDCDDTDPLVNPGVVENPCDGVDTDCDGFFSAGETSDLDGDGAVDACDCDDLDPTVFLGAPELCDGLDNDCDGTVPVAETVDSDNDGVFACADCDDDSSSVGAVFLSDDFNYTALDPDGSFPPPPGFPDVDRQINFTAVHLPSDGSETPSTGKVDLIDSSVCAGNAATDALDIDALCADGLNDDAGSLVLGRPVPPSDPADDMLVPRDKTWCVGFRVTPLALDPVEHYPATCLTWDGGFTAWGPADVPYHKFCPGDGFAIAMFRHDVPAIGEGNLGRWSSGFPTDDTGSPPAWSGGYLGVGGYPGYAVEFDAFINAGGFLSDLNRTLPHVQFLASDPSLWPQRPATWLADPGDIIDDEALWLRPSATEGVAEDGSLVYGDYFVWFRWTSESQTQKTLDVWVWDLNSTSEPRLRSQDVLATHLDADGHNLVGKGMRLALTSGKYGAAYSPYRLDDLTVRCHEPSPGACSVGSAQEWLAEVRANHQQELDFAGECREANSGEGCLNGNRELRRYGRGGPRDAPEDRPANRGEERALSRYGDAKRP